MCYFLNLLMVFHVIEKLGNILCDVKVAHLDTSPLLYKACFHSKNPASCSFSGTAAYVVYIYIGSYNRISLSCLYFPLTNIYSSVTFSYV